MEREDSVYCSLSIPILRDPPRMMIDLKLILETAIQPPVRLCAPFTIV